MFDNAKSQSFNSLSKSPLSTGYLPAGGMMPLSETSPGFMALFRNPFRSSSTPTESTTLASYGGTVASYGGVIEPTPYKVHFNQGIGNGAEGGDPGKSQPHGSSNDELGQTPGNLFY